MSEPEKWMYHPNSMLVTAGPDANIDDDVADVFWVHLDGKIPDEKATDARGYLIAAAPQLLAACQAMLEPFGRRQGFRGQTICPLCDYSALPAEPRQHTDNCPIPKAEAAIALAQPTPAAQSPTCSGMGPEEGGE
jgi:hypothetical protein